MLQVLLVDDEPFILQGLAMLIDWEKEGFTLAGTAANGLEAIAFLEKKIRKIFPKTEKGELFGGALEVLLICLFSFFDSLRSASGVSACCVSSGNFLVLPASCYKVPKDRKHEGV